MSHIRVHFVIVIIILVIGATLGSLKSFIGKLSSFFIMPNALSERILFNGEKNKNHRVSKASTHGKLMLNIHDPYIDILNSFSKIIKIRQVYIKKDYTRELYSS